MLGWFAAVFVYLDVWFQRRRWRAAIENLDLRDPQSFWPGDQVAAEPHLRARREVVRQRHVEGGQGKSG